MQKHYRIGIYQWNPKREQVMIRSMLRGLNGLIKSGVLFQFYSMLGLGTAILMCIVSDKTDLFPGLLDNPISYLIILFVSPVLAFSDRKSKEYGHLVPQLLAKRTGQNIIGAAFFYVFSLFFFDFFWLI
ncbi:MAG: hypothetical protein GY804_11080 [Alphaproteobacteria bacterium]|nr:hypothetical protein [Alphaproteobacteria bacterium]